MLPLQQGEDCIQKKKSRGNDVAFSFGCQMYKGVLVKKVELGDFSLGVGFLYISQTILNYIYGLKGISGN